jgi:hypothetical protein
MKTVMGCMKTKNRTPVLYKKAVSAIIAVRAFQKKEKDDGSF